MLFLCLRVANNLQIATCLLSAVWTTLGSVRTKEHRHDRDTCLPWPCSLLPILQVQGLHNGVMISLLLCCSSFYLCPILLFQTNGRFLFLSGLIRMNTDVCGISGLRFLFWRVSDADWLIATWRQPFVSGQKRPMMWMRSSEGAPAQKTSWGPVFFSLNATASFSTPKASVKRIT